MTARKCNIALVSFIAISALWLAAATRVHVNTSWSHDAWGYLALPLMGDPEIGDMVLFDPRPDRGPGQAPATGPKIPYLKTVRGLPGGRVTVDGARRVAVNGAILGVAKSRALDGRPLEAARPGVVPAGHYYLHGDHIDSHDSRYAEIGPVPADRILGRAIALPDLPWLGLKGPLVGAEDVRAGESGEARR